MNTSLVSRPFTYDDYLALPDDGKRYQVIEGEISMTPAPSPRHQEIQADLCARMVLHVREHLLGKVYVSPIDVALSMVDIVQPDILFVAKDRMDIVAKKNIVGIPNLIVEILSPSSVERDRVEKMTLYERYGLPEYWIVDPDSQTVDVYLSAANRLEKVETLKVGEELHSRQIPGLVLELSEIFKS